MQFGNNNYIPASSDPIKSAWQKMFTAWQPQQHHQNLILPFPAGLIPQPTYQTMENSLALQLNVLAMMDQNEKIFNTLRQNLIQCLIPQNTLSIPPELKFIQALYPNLVAGLQEKAKYIPLATGLDQSIQDDALSTKPESLKEDKSERPDGNMSSMNLNVKEEFMEEKPVIKSKLKKEETKVKKVMRKKITKRKKKRHNVCGHPEKEHYAKNLCYNCYHRRGRTKKPWKCNHERMYARGLCQNCYINDYNRKRRLVELKVDV